MRALLAFASVAVIACSCGDSTAARDAACKAFVDGVLDSASRCPSVSGYPRFELQRDGLTLACNTAFEAEGIAPDFAAQVSACGAKFASPACPDRRDEPIIKSALAECKLSGGSLADDEPCSADYQCASGTCAYLVASCRKCATLVPLGGDCSKKACVAGARCEVRGDGASGTTAECVLQGPQEGEACAKSPFPRCAAGLHCMREPDNSTPSEVCRSPQRAGGPCNMDSECAGGLVCRVTREMKRKCLEPLREGGDCTFGGCAPDLGCGAGAKCAPVQIVSMGSPCGDGVTYCGEGFCLFSATSGPGGTCTAYLLEGAPCGPYDQCAAGLICDRTGRSDRTDPGTCTRARVSAPTCP